MSPFAHMKQTKQLRLFFMIFVGAFIAALQMSRFPQACAKNAINNQQLQEGIPASNAQTAPRIVTPPWMDFEQFAANQISSPETSKTEPPNEEDWLLPSVQHPSPSSQSFIPRQIFKVNIQSHGHLQALFRADEEKDNNETSFSESDIKALQSLRKAHNSWREMNPGYQIRYFDLLACRKYLQDFFHPVFLRAFDCIEAFGGKANLFRYLVIYREGGFYSDWKQVCLKEGLLDELSGISISNTTGAIEQQSSNITGVFFWDTFSKGPTPKKHGLICYQNAFFGSTNRHPVLKNVIQKVLHNVQAKFYGVHALQTTGVCVFGQAVADERFKHQQNPTATIEGSYKWHRNLQHNQFRIGHRNEPVVQHKCHDCGLGSSWVNGNDYYVKWNQSEYYCDDASSIFAT